jgi:hypothetical protein
MSAVRNACEPIRTSLVVDFDYTIIRPNSGELFHYWLNNDVLKKRQSPLRLFFGFFNMFRMYCGLPKYFYNDLIQMKYSDYESHINNFVESHSLDFELNKELLESVRDFNGLRILLTGSPELLAQKLLEKFGENPFDVVIGLKPGFHPWYRPSHPFGRSKYRLVQDFSPIISIGDSWSDRHLFKKSEIAFVVGSGMRIGGLARIKRWNRITWGKSLRW